MPPEKALGILASLLVYLVVKAGCVAMSIWLDKAAPAFTARALNAYQARGLRCFVLGVVNGIVLMFLFVVLVNSQVKPLAVLGVLTLFVTVACVMAGYMIAYHDVGRRLRGENEWSATRTILFGGITAEAAFMAPVLGQVFSIGVLFRGFGAVISGLLSRESARLVEPASEDAPQDS